MHPLLQKIADHLSVAFTGRSPHWPAARRAWLKQYPTCAACGTAKSVQVHHKQPFHLYPARELDPTNFITLCECSPYEDHLEVGHKGNWKLFNADVVAEAARLITQRQPTKGSHP